MLFASDDLLEYKEVGLLKLGEEYVEKVSCQYVLERGKVQFIWQEQAGSCFASQKISIVL